MGACDKEKLSQMLYKINHPITGVPKEIFNKKTLAINSKISNFQTTLLNGQSIDLKKITGTNGGIIFFSRSSCPFSLDALDDFDTLAKIYKTKGISTTIIIQDETDIPLNVYQDLKNVTFLIRDKQNILFKQFGVTTTPYFYLLDGNNIIKKHRSFTKKAAENAILAMQGTATPKDSMNCVGAG
jgi:peroxiredoxin